MAPAPLFFPRSQWGRMGPGSSGWGPLEGRMLNAGSNSQSLLSLLLAQPLLRHRHREVGHNSQEAKDPVHGQKSTASDLQC